jgi:sulfofructose kinase
VEFDVIGLGMNCADCILQVSTLPQDNDATPPQLIIDWTIQGGGKVATAMTATSQLGAKTAMVTKVGVDEWGQFVIDDFAKYGVDTQFIYLDPTVDTAIAFILIGAKGMNRWVSARSLERWSLPSPIQKAVQWVVQHPSPENFFSQAIPYSKHELIPVTAGKILNLDGFPAEATLVAARQAYVQGIPTVFDMYSHPHLSELLRYITYCIPSYRSAMAFTNEVDPRAMCKKIQTYGPEVVGITLGEDGVVFYASREFISRKAFAISAVDTTGAGDVFHGAFSYGVLQGWSLPRIIEFASAVAALKCRQLGGRAGIPVRHEVETFLHAHVETIRDD